MNQNKDVRKFDIDKLKSELAKRGKTLQDCAAAVNRNAGYFNDRVRKYDSTLPHREITIIEVKFAINPSSIYPDPKYKKAKNNHLIDSHVMAKLVLDFVEERGLKSNVISRAAFKRAVPGTHFSEGYITTQVKACATKGEDGKWKAQTIDLGIVDYLYENYPEFRERIQPSLGYEPPLIEGESSQEEEPKEEELPPEEEHASEPVQDPQPENMAADEDLVKPDPVLTLFISDHAYGWLTKAEEKTGRSAASIASELLDSTILTIVVNAKKRQLAKFLGL